MCRCVCSASVLFDVLLRHLNTNDNHKCRTGAALGQDEIKDEDEDKLIIIQKTKTN